MVKLRKIGCTRRYRRRADGFVAELDRDTAGQSNEPSMHSSTSSGLVLDRPFSRVAGHGCLGGNRRANGRCSAPGICDDCGCTACKPIGDWSRADLDGSRASPVLKLVLAEAGITQNLAHKAREYVHARSCRCYLHRALGQCLIGNRIERSLALGSDGKAALTLPAYDARQYARARRCTGCLFRASVVST
jgi:hypothetical protein